MPHVAMPKGMKPKKDELSATELVQKIDALAAEMGVEGDSVTPTTEELIAAKREEMARKRAAREGSIDKP